MSKQSKTIYDYLITLQHSLTDAIEAVDGEATFQEDRWERAGGGGGFTRVLADGGVFERAGVNFSHVFGDQLPPSATAQRPHLAGSRFEAMGVSLVFHPRNPFVPTTHFNVRYFEAQPENAEPVSWFGGGYDLTPYYGFEEDCVHWHQVSKKACDPFGPETYPKLKKWCDEYFYLKHRQEPRGIGGLFFDDWSDRGFELIQSVGNSFLEAYLPIVERRKETPYTEEHRAFQKVRRGRYVEYNLVYDRGTLFGLQSNGRTESILMSLPPEVSWRYQYQTQPGSPEEKLRSYFLQERDWLGAN